MSEDKKKQQQNEESDSDDETNEGEEKTDENNEWNKVVQDAEAASDTARNGITDDYVALSEITSAVSTFNNGHMKCVF